MTSVDPIEFSDPVQSALNHLRDGLGYEYGPFLGKGTYGSVVKVRKDKSEYAAKIVEKRMLNQMEIYIWPKLKHQNVLRLVDSLTDLDETVVFFTEVMESNLFLKLQSHAFREDPRSLEKCRVYMKQVFSGMSYLHRHKLCHLDLRSENVFLSKDNDRAVVADFSGLCWSDAERRFCPLPHSLRPPEMLSSKNRVLPMPIDLWACGLLMASTFMGKGFYICTVKNAKAGHIDAVRQYTGFFQCEVYVKRFVSETYPNCNLTDYSIRSFINLLGRFLRMNPKNRLKVDDAMKHTFFSCALGVIKVDKEPGQKRTGSWAPGHIQDGKSSALSNSVNFQITISKSVGEVVSNFNNKEKEDKKLSKWTKCKMRIMQMRKLPTKSAPFFKKIRFKNLDKNKDEKNKTVKDDTLDNEDDLSKH